MPYAKMFELAALIRATDDPDTKILLMTELRKLLDEETARLKVQTIKKSSQSSSNRR